MKKWGILLAVLLGFFALTGCGSEEMTKSSLSTPDGRLDFALEDTDGQVRHLSDYRGKKVYIKFWGTWCPACMKSLPETARVAEELKKSGQEDIVVLSVVAPGLNGEKKKGAFKDWFKGTDYTALPVLFDETGQVNRAFNIHLYPSSVFINTAGDVVKVRPGSVDAVSLKKEMEKIS